MSLALAGGVTAGILLLIFGGSDSAPAGRGPLVIPEGETLRAFAASVCDCATELLESGPATDDELRLCVLARAYPTIVWPPRAGDHPTVADAWELATEVIAAYVEDPEAFCREFEILDLDFVPPEPEPEPEPEIGPAPEPEPEPQPEPEILDVELIPLIEEGDADPEEYPFEIPRLHLGADGYHWPTPSTFYQVDRDNVRTDPQFALRSLLGISRAALGSAYAMAGAPRTLGSISGDLVLAYARLIACENWNDALYGQTDPDLAGGPLGIGPHGRGPAMLPMHRDVLARLEGFNETPTRTIRLDGSREPGVDSDNRNPTFWLPAINLDLLRDSFSVTTQGLQWSDGSSTLNPPPSIYGRGVAAISSPAGGWGC